MATTTTSPYKPLSSSSISSNVSLSSMPHNERQISWRELRKLYDFDDKVSASGGYGSIFVGTKIETGEAVVLKTVNIHSCAFRRFRCLTPENVEELKKYIVREWNFLSMLEHPHIVSAKDTVIYLVKNPCRCGGDHSGLLTLETEELQIHDDIYIIIMERMTRDLYDEMHFWRGYRPSPQRLKLTSFGQLVYSRLPPRYARQIFYQVCKALDYLHERPMLHRDLSWGNVMLRRSEDGQRIIAKIVDLGLSRDMPQTPNGLSVENIGTIAFVAPELHYSELKTCGYGTKIDVWSLGILLYLLLTGHSDPNERSLRFRTVIDAIENDHDLCMEKRREDQEEEERYGKMHSIDLAPTTCLFCEELLNDRFQEALSAADIMVKKEALTLLEGMLQVSPEERFTIKQVLRHPWLEEERAQDPSPVDTEEETLLFRIPRRRQRQGKGNNNNKNNNNTASSNTGAPAALEVYVKRFEYPYLRDPDCTILCSCYRDTARDCKLGDATTFGGILSRVGVSTGERMLVTMAPFEEDEYLVSLDPCIPRRMKGKFFKHAYLCLLDQPNDRRSVYGIYKSLREGLEVGESTCLVMPLLGFDVRFEQGSVYKGLLGDKARKRFVLQQWLSFAFHLAQTTALESLSLSSWKHATYTLVKEASVAGTNPFVALTELFDDEGCEERFREQAHRIRLLVETGPLLSGGALALDSPAQGKLQSALGLLLELMLNLRYAEEGGSEAAAWEAERMICQTVGVIAEVLLVLLLPGADVEGGGGGGVAVGTGEEGEDGGGEEEEEGVKLTMAQEDVEDVFLALLLMQSNYEKLLVEGGEILINRVDAAASLNSLELVLEKAVEGGALMVL